MRADPKPQELYRHFKGNIYQIRCLARHTETREMMVVYQAMYDTFEIYVRPLSMFMEEVDHVKYPDVRQRYRFELLQDAKQEAVAGDTVSFRVKETQPEVPQEDAGMEEGQDGSVQIQEEEQEQEQELNLDPLVMEFLDADTYEQRLNILVALHGRITDEMINTMAVAVDLEVKEGDIETRYEELKNCLLTFEKYECNRLR